MYFPLSVYIPIPFQGPISKQSETKCDSWLKKEKKIKEKRKKNNFTIVTLKLIYWTITIVEEKQDLGKWQNGECDAWVRVLKSILICFGWHWHSNGNEMTTHHLRFKITSFTTFVLAVNVFTFHILHTHRYQIDFFLLQTSGAYGTDWTTTEMNPFKFTF